MNDQEHRVNALAVRLLTVVILCGAVGCTPGPKSAKGFTLPDGDVERGKEVFLSLRCYDCHSISGVDLPDAEEPDQVVVKLGGEVRRIKTYGELVTSIINPSHRLARGYLESLVAEEGESKMKNYNDVLTVSQLIDLVAFLQAHYELEPYEPTIYPYYYGP